MSRRTFFKLIGIAGASLKFSPTIAAALPSIRAVNAPLPAPAERQARASRARYEELLAPDEQCASEGRQLELQRSPLAGFQYHHGEDVWLQLAVGMPLDLVREPDNRYDERAVRIDWRGLKLGYVPRLDNAAISQLLDRGEMVSAEIVALRESHDPWKRIAVRIDVET